MESRSVLDTYTEAGQEEGSSRAAGKGDANASADANIPAVLVVEAPGHDLHVT